jgi:hypothetical protein
MENNLPEVWLRGPMEGMPPLLNPIASALIQVYEELVPLLDSFPEDRLWYRPFGMASVGFHLNHLTGVLDRLFTYARTEKLSPDQFTFLSLEGIPPDPPISVKKLIQNFKDQLDKALNQLKTNLPEELLLERKIGRLELPSTVIGLYIHAAEHSTRHFGQLLVTSKLVRSLKEEL